MLEGISLLHEISSEHVHTLKSQMTLKFVREPNAPFPSVSLRLSTRIMIRYIQISVHFRYIILLSLPSLGAFPLPRRP